MNHIEYYKSGEMKGEGEMLDLIDCTSRGSGHQIQIDDHEFCVECMPSPTSRKINSWKYYNKNGIVILTGKYVVLDYIGVPSVKDGIWLVFRDNGSLLQQIVYEAGKIIDLSTFDEDNEKIE